MTIANADLELLKRLKEIMKLSKQVKQAQVAKYLGISEADLLKKLVEWNEIPISLKNETIVVENLVLFDEVINEKLLGSTIHSKNTPENNHHTTPDKQDPDYFEIKPAGTTDILTGKATTGSERKGFSDGILTPPPLILNGVEYQLLEKLDQGGMGTISFVRNTRNGKICVLKEIIPNRNFEREKYWTRERDILKKQAQSPVRSVQFIDSCKKTENNTTNYYILMEYISGITLKKWIEQQGPADTIEKMTHRIQEILMPLCSHIHYIHEHGIIHRDITPKNVMIEEEGGAKVVPVLIDWGIAQEYSLKDILNPSPQYLKTAKPSATIITSVGTPPEIMCGLPSIVASDIYMFGHVIYFIFSGYERERHPATKQDYVLKLNEKNPKVPDRLQNLIEKMTEYEPAERIATVNLVKKELEEILVGLESRGSNRNQEEGLDKPILPTETKRKGANYKDVKSKFKTFQNWMPPLIGDFVNDAFYNNQRENDLSTVYHGFNISRQNLCSKKFQQGYFELFTFLTTSQFSALLKNEERGKEAESWDNPLETEYVWKLLDNIISQIKQTGINNIWRRTSSAGQNTHNRIFDENQPMEIGILSFYNSHYAQIKKGIETQSSLVEIDKKVRKRVFKVDNQPIEISIGVVEQFKNDPKDIVILPLTRTNRSRSIGILNEKGITSTAFSSAKQNLFIIGDWDFYKDLKLDSNRTLENEIFIKLCDYLNDHRLVAFLSSDSEIFEKVKQVKIQYYNKSFD